MWWIKYCRRCGGLVVVTVVEERAVWYDGGDSQEALGIIGICFSFVPRCL